MSSAAAPSCRVRALAHGARCNCGSEFDEDGEMDMIGEGEEGGEEGEEGDGAAADDQVIDIDRPLDGEEGQAVAMEDRITTPYMTKYERARILGTRALQIR